MDLTWDFQRILREIEEVKKWKTRSYEDEASKYYALKTYHDLLFRATANDRQLKEKDAIMMANCTHDRYTKKKRSLEKKLVKTFNEQGQQMLIDFMKLTKDYSLRGLLTTVESPIATQYNYQLPIETVIGMGNKFYNTMPFVDKNSISQMAENNLIYVVDNRKTTNPSAGGNFFTTGHIMCSYKEQIDFYTLMTLIHEAAHSKDFSHIRGFFAKELHIDNIFCEFFSKLMELLSLDFFMDNCTELALDINLYKYNFLNNQNRHLKNVISKVDNPNDTLYKIQTNHPIFLLDGFGMNATPQLASADALYDEKKHYQDIINYMEKELLASQETTAFSEFIGMLRHPIAHILAPLTEMLGGTRYASVRFADNILGDGKYMMGTSLAMKFYYLIKEDREKGIALLKVVSEELRQNYQNSAQVLKKHDLEDYLTPDYIQQYASDYNKEKELVKRALKK